MGEGLQVTTGQQGAPAAGPGPQVLSIEDVHATDFPGTPLTVFGSPIRHSVSPQMHNRALAAMTRADSRFANWRYHRVEVPPERLPEALGLCARKGFRGINLTLPHKVDALRHIARVDPSAQAFGAVNTLRLDDDGLYTGFNTDGYGFEAAVREELGIALPGRHVILLGAGGAARAIAAQCLASRCASLHIGNRTADRLDALLALLKPFDNAHRLRGFDLASPDYDALPPDALIVNATTLGLKPEDPAPLDLGLFPPEAAVYDTTYGSHRSRLQRDAFDRGLRSANGLSMLVWQGARSLEIWTGASVPASEMRMGAEEALLLRR